MHIKSIEREKEMIISFKGRILVESFLHLSKRKKVTKRIEDIEK